MDLGFNKVAFCVLATGLLVIGLGQFSRVPFKETKHDKAGYFVEVKEAASETPGSEEPAGPVDYGTLLRNASVDAGKQVAVKCQQCHSEANDGKIVQGPPLWGIIDRDVASYPGFKYTAAPKGMQGVGGKWTYEKLDVYLKRPKAMVPDTAMNFVGLKKQDDRINLIAYLRTLTSGEPEPLPDPLPPEATAPADAAAPADGAAPAAPADGAAPAPASPDAPATPADAGKEPAKDKAPEPAAPKP
ncbi:MAG: c-type cytochrome [Alphaproteobacteria bacterium]|nr:c-type cytochrome [Alphaproteobacteria bacterium]